MGGVSVRDSPLRPVPVCCVLPVQQECHRLLDEGDTPALSGHHFHGRGEVLQESHHILPVHLIDKQLAMTIRAFIMITRTRYHYTLMKLEIEWVHTDQKLAMA